MAAAHWVDDGATSQYVVVPATDPALVDAWFGLGFGQQHVHAIREVPGPGEIRRPPDGIVVRPARRADIPALAALEVELPRHIRPAPRSSRAWLPGELPEATIGEWEADFDDPRFHVVVAEHGGQVIGSAVGCSIVESSEHHGLVRPPDAGYLAFAAVFPEARGLGAGTALGEAGPRVGARRRGKPTGRHRLAPDQPALEPDLAPARVPSDASTAPSRDRLR